MNAPMRHGLSAESTQIAQENTMLSPRFYTTDFDELDKTDVSSVRAQWDELIAELKSDPNKRHFLRNEEFEADFSNLPEELCREKGIKTVGMTGVKEGKMDALCDFLIKVPSLETPRIQESHMTIYHSMCAAIEKSIFGDNLF